MPNLQTAPSLLNLRAALALAIVVPIVAGCAATVDRGQSPTAAPSATSSATPSATGAPPAAPTVAAQPSMKIPAASAKRVVLNMQLDAKHPKDSGWNEFKKEWNDIGKEQVTAKKMAFVTQEGDAKPTGEDGTLVVVKVSDYKVVSQTARIFLGIMTGNSYINAKVEFRDLKTGALRGERNYDTTSSAWQGVFAPTTYKQIYALVDQIVDEIGRN
jgi:hypothetical protein